MGSDLLSRTPPTADHRVHYGSGALQFGDLWLPAMVAGQKAPVVVFIHGGWWQNSFGLEYGGHLCKALKAAGVAVWSLEYRRVGDEGGGWPGTFEDVAAGYDHLTVLAKQYGLELRRVVVAGHSAGGHLAFWLAGRHHIPESSVLHRFAVNPVPIAGVVSLAGAVGLQMTIDLSGWFQFAHDKQEVYSLMGGRPEGYQDRYAAGDPGRLLPFNVRQVLLQGTEDDQIPPKLPATWANDARRGGDEVTVTMLQGSEHMDVVDPLSKGWPKVQAAILAAGR